MNTKHFSILFYLIILSLCFGNIIHAQQTDIDPNGYNKFYYDDGTLSSEGYMTNGKPNGYWKNYHPNGQLKSEGNRRDFLLDSTWKFFNEEGKITLEINYLEGKKNGYRTTYQGDEVLKDHFENDVQQGYSLLLYPNGLTKMKTPFVNGLEEGVAREYDLEGTITQLITYRKGYVLERSRINRYDSDSLAHGLWKWFYEEEELLRLEGSFKHGLKNGYFKDYDKEGNLLSVVKYIDGEKIEKAEELEKLDVRTDYYPDGSVKIVATYNKDGVPEGVRREYDNKGKVEKAFIFRHGRIIAEGIFTNSGKKEGLWKEYYPDGTLKATGSYENDLKVGDWKFYYINGQLEQQGEHIAGEPEGIWKWYYKSGKLLREESFMNGLADGVLTEYDEEGNIITQGDFIEGKKDGLWFYKVGDNKDEGVYADGFRNGKWTAYYAEGNLSFEGKFVDDLPNGEHIWYWPNGRIKMQGRYVMGQKQGDWRKYDADGLPIILITYKVGKEEKVDGVDLD